MMRVFSPIRTGKSARVAEWRTSWRRSTWATLTVPRAGTPRTWRTATAVSDARSTRASGSATPRAPAWPPPTCASTESPSSRSPSSSRCSCPSHSNPIRCHLPVTRPRMRGRDGACEHFKTFRPARSFALTLEKCCRTERRTRYVNKKNMFPNYMYLSYYRARELWTRHEYGGNLFTG